MTPPILIELAWRRIDIPPTARYHRTTCPKCSPWRTKAGEKCRVIRIKSPTRAETECHHCGRVEEIAA